MIKKIFGERLKQIRKQSNLTTTALGNLVGVSHTTISRWENGVIEASLNHIYKLAKVLNVSSDYLIGIED